MQIPGLYRPNNAFSFSFYKRKNDGTLDEFSKVEYPFVNGPTQYTENFKFRISYEPTFGGTAVTDFGVGNSEIKLEGEFYIWHSGIPSDTEKTGAFSSVSNAIIDAGKGYAEGVMNKYLKFIPGVSRTGVQEFHDFIFMLYSSKFKDNYYISSDPYITKLKTLYSVEGGFDFSNFGFVFSDYDRQRYSEVIIPENGFTITRSVDDTNTYKFSLNLVSIRDMNKMMISQQAIRINPAFAISGLINELETLINLPLELSGALVRLTQFVDTTITNLRNLAPAWDRMKNSLNEDGMLMRRNFQSISENLKGIIGANKKQWTTEAISAELDRTYDMARSAEAGFMQEIENATSGLAGLMSLLGAYTTPVSGDSSYEFEALQPGADFTEWIDNDLYTFIIDAQNIIIEMEAAIAISNSEEKYRIYELQPGESYDSIAEKVLGTKDLGQALSIWNEDTKGKLARHSIRIPIGTETGIFTKLPFNPSPRDLEIGLVGVDLKLTVQRDFAVAPNGDLAIISGDESLINSLLDLVDVPQGSWIADLSKGNPVPIGELPNTIINGGFILDLLSQIQKNPKVETAEFTGLEQDGDVLMYLFNVYSVSGRSYVIEL